MRVIPDDRSVDVANRAARPHRFWQRLAQMLDDYFINRMKRVVPDATLRRSRHEIDRCRRLMLNGALARDHGRAVYALPRRASRTAPRYD